MKRESDVVTDRVKKEYGAYGKGIDGVFRVSSSTLYRIAFRGVMILCLSFSFVADSLSATPILWWELDQAERYLLRQNDTKGHWKNWRKERGKRRKAQSRHKRLVLRDEEYGSKEQGNGDKEEYTKRYDSNTEVFVKDPLGIVSKVKPVQESGKIVVYVPNILDLNGRYILGSRTTEAVDGAGSKKSGAKVFVCAKTFVVHMKSGGKTENKTGLFFNDPEKMPLEIGPMPSSDKNPYAGMMQTEHDEQVMQVRYRGKPLAGIGLRVKAESGWSRDYRTSENGACTVIPIEDRSDDRIWQRYLYEATYYDKITGNHYRASFTTIVYDYRNKWQSMLLGVTVLSASTVGLVVCAGTAVFYYRRKKRTALPVVLKDCQLVRNMRK